MSEPSTSVVLVVLVTSVLLGVAHVAWGVRRHYSTRRIFLRALPVSLPIVLCIARLLRPSTLNALIVGAAFVAVIITFGFSALRSGDTKTPEQADKDRE
jgi:hypothetical protein